MENSKKTATDKGKTSGDAKGKASMDQNGEGASPKYGEASGKPNESGETQEKADTSIEKRNKK